jgi:Phage derived protein Gp49-like (DUF891)
MGNETKWRLQFLAFQSSAEGRPVQDWFDGLPEDDKWEIVDLLDALQKINGRRWPDEVFDPLQGAGGISEIKIPNIKCFRASKYQMITYRIYGYFGPKGYYTCLHGTAKDVKNDEEGKRIAKRRLDELQRGLRNGVASVSKFNFEEGIDSATSERASRPN